MKLNFSSETVLLAYAILGFQMDRISNKSTERDMTNSSPMHNPVDAIMKRGGVNFLVDTRSLASTIS